MRVLGGIPGGLIAARVGPKRAVVGGAPRARARELRVRVAGSPLALGASRFLQGFSSTTTWAGALAWVTVESDRARRGQTLGTVFGFAVAGAIVGPMFGAVATSVSIEVAFTVVGVVALALAAAAALHPPARAQDAVRGGISVALSDPAFLVGLWLNTLPAFFFGVLDVLAPLALDGAGYGAFAIGTVFVLAGIAEVCAAPIVGRASDRHGRLLPIQISLAAASTTAVLLAARLSARSCSSPSRSWARCRSARSSHPAWRSSPTAPSSPASPSASATAS